MSQAPRLFAIDRNKLDDIVAPVAAAHGAEVFDIEFKSDSGGWVLRIFVEKLGSSAGRLSTIDAAVDLEQCSNIARELSPALDVHDLIPQRYNLEVGSPGVERPLSKLADFERFAGLKAKLRVQTAIAGQKVLVGILGTPVGEQLYLQDGSRTFDTPLHNVVSAHLVFEYGPHVKPIGVNPAAAKPAAAKPVLAKPKSAKTAAAKGAARATDSDVPVGAPVGQSPKGKC